MFFKLCAVRYCLVCHGKLSNLDPLLFKDRRPSPLKKSRFHFLSKMTHSVLKRMKNQLSYFCDCSQFSSVFTDQNWKKNKCGLKRWSICAIFSLWDIVNFSNDCVHILQVFLTKCLGSHTSRLSTWAASPGPIGL